MSFFEDWNNKIKNDENKQEHTEFVQRYYALEESAYKTILSSYPAEWSGNVPDLSGRLGFGEDRTIFIGFLDGINESIKTRLDLDSIDEQSSVVLDVDYEKLYWNMHEAKADWLYKLKEWDQVIDESRRNELAKQYRTSKIVHNEKIGRNDACPCGSGKKYKNCCLK